MNKVEQEVREYTDARIVYMDEPFPQNHLYCVRGKYCEFAEHTNSVCVYVYPSRTRPRNYPATRGGNKTGPKSRFKDGSQNWTVRIPKDPTQAEECKRLIRLVIERYAVGAVIVK